MALRNENHRPMTWNEKRHGRIPEYKYTTVNEVFDNRCSGNCNVYGVVFDLKTPSQSRGSDFFALILIVDPSAKKPLKIRLFHRDVNYFPKVECGDIVRIHRLKVYNHKGDVSLTSTKGWSWVLWRHSDADNPVMKELSGTPSYTLLKSDEETVEKLRQWQKQYASIAKDWCFQRQMTISEINHEDHCIVYCQIVNFLEDDRCCYIQIWDGTKPSIKFHTIPFDETDESSSLGVPEGYAVNVVISKDHYAHFKCLEISRGDFVKFSGLYAAPNYHNAGNSVTNEDRCSELQLYEGKANGREIAIAQQNEHYDRLESFIAHAKALNDNEESQDTLDLLKHLDNQARRFPTKRPRLTEDINPNPLQDTEDGKRQAEANLTNEVCQNSATGNYTSEANPLQDTEDGGKPEAEADLTNETRHDSASEISGDGLPAAMSSLKTVLREDIPLSNSKLFRVKIRILSLNTPNNGWVGHYSPNTSMFFPSQNDGKNLKITTDVERFVKSWRQVSGKNDLNSEELDNVDSQPASQWKIPYADGNTAAAETQTYVNPNDDSQWKSIKLDDFIVRKRKLNNKEFSILYILRPEDFSSDELVKYKSNYNRVVRVLPLRVLTSNVPPAVGIQDDVFYYSCPANANLPVIPSLKDEAASFQESRISNVAGSPVLVPRYDIPLRVEDDAGTLDKLHVSGNNATQFFWGVTPQMYLANVEHYSNLLSSNLEDLIQKQQLMECIIEKKSRKHFNDLSKRVYSYEIRNTSLMKQISKT